mgnify:CR=1 FL=1
MFSTLNMHITWDWLTCSCTRSHDRRFMQQWALQRAAHFKVTYFETTFFLLCCTARTIVSCHPHWRTEACPFACVHHQKLTFPKTCLNLELVCHSCHFNICSSDHFKHAFYKLVNITADLHHYNIISSWHIFYICHMHFFCLFYIHWASVFDILISDSGFYLNFYDLMQHINHEFWYSVRMGKGEEIICTVSGGVKTFV